MWRLGDARQLATAAIVETFKLQTLAIHYEPGVCDCFDDGVMM